MTDIFIDMYYVERSSQALHILKDMGMEWDGVECQPMADQIKLSNCINIPDELPEWARRSKHD